jgi:hypothetical protein
LAAQFLRVANLKEGSKTYTTGAEKVGNTISRGSSGETRNSGSGIMRTYMALCGFESVGGGTSKPPLLLGTGLNKDGVGPCPSSLCGTPTFEMSNARLVGPEPVSNHSDWPTRAVCRATMVLSISRRRCWCIAVQVSGKRAVPAPLSLT